MKIISNATPLIYLGKLGRLNLLQQLYGEVLLPTEVYQEVVVNGLRIGASEARLIDLLIQQGTLIVVHFEWPQEMPDWIGNIDAGEAEAILLAQQEKADLVLLDNLHARRAAQNIGLNVKGTMGLFLESYRQGYLDLKELEQIVEYVKSQADFWISDRLCDTVLQTAYQESS